MNIIKLFAATLLFAGSAVFAEEKEGGSTEDDILSIRQAPAPYNMIGYFGFVKESPLVKKEQDAKMIAFHEYVKQLAVVGNVRNRDVPKEVELITMAYDIPSFAKKGDYLWEVRIMHLGSLRSIIWVNAETADAYPVCGPWDLESRDVKKIKIVGVVDRTNYEKEEPGSVSEPVHRMDNIPIPDRNYTNLNGKVVNILGHGHIIETTDDAVLPGYKIDNELLAVRVAEAVARRMPELGFLRGVETVRGIFNIGYDIPGFVNEGEQVWEVAYGNGIGDLIIELKGICWINAKTGDVYFSYGPWYNDPEGSEYKELYKSVEKYSDAYFSVKDLP
jgi:hypothetical protein